jgi:NAD(P)-dependent dehydrogenase (short-subunit alcohol dehydrogenase family)
MMRDNERYRYDGRRVLVVGGASGMGAAAAQTAASLGAEVVVLDHASVDYDVKAFVKVDLRDRASVDDALAQVEGPVDALFAAAGVADGTPGVTRINFISHRHILGRLVDDGRLGRGSAVCMISSVAGLGWEARIPKLLEFLANEDWEAADAWVEAHDGSDSYTFSKEAMNCFVADRAFSLLSKGVRINAICPGPTDTPLARANADTWLAFGQDYREATGTAVLSAEQMGDAMVFLNSAAASGISGVNLLVDTGYVMSSLTGSFAPGHALVQFLLGRGR